jgi:DNA-binding GntR family transcriptional regulator
MAARATSARATTATQRVYDAIYAAILEHRLAPGTRLREAELADSFDVSRTLVRQALQRLAQDQLVVLEHNHGAQVAQPSRDDARHVFEARRLVECEVARQLGGRLDAAALTRLRAVVQAEAEAEARGDVPAGIRLSGEFHRELARLAGNPVFVRLVDALLPTTSMLMALYQPQGAPACVNHRHAQLIQALQRGGATAAAEMRRHLQEIERSLDAHDAGATPPKDVFRRYRERTVRGATGVR